MCVKVHHVCASSSSRSSSSSRVRRGRSRDAAVRPGASRSAAPQKLESSRIDGWAARPASLRARVGTVEEKVRGWRCRWRAEAGLEGGATRWTVEWGWCAAESPAQPRRKVEWWVRGRGEERSVRRRRGRSLRASSSPRRAASAASPPRPLQVPSSSTAAASDVSPSSHPRPAEPLLTRPLLLPLFPPRRATTCRLRLALVFSPSPAPRPPSPLRLPTHPQRYIRVPLARTHALAAGLEREEETTRPTAAREGASWSFAQRRTTAAGRIEAGSSRRDSCPGELRRGNGRRRRSRPPRRSTCSRSRPWTLQLTLPLPRPQPPCRSSSPKLTCSSSTSCVC